MAYNHYYYFLGLKNKTLDLFEIFNQEEFNIAPQTIRYTSHTYTVKSVQKFPFLNIN